MQTTEHKALCRTIMKREIWLITSEHLEDALWFPEQSDFKVGMNYVAVLAASMSVIILAFVLMSNHVHFIIYGTREEALAFVNELKRRMAQYLKNKYGMDKTLKSVELDIRPVPVEDDALERAIAYVQMNPVAANICLNPTQYAWGSGNTFFNASPEGGKPVSSYTARGLRRLLHSKEKVPGEWLVSVEGFILPSSYVKAEFVERHFRTPKRMNFFLANSSKARARLAAGEDSLPSFTDQNVKACVTDLCRTLYGKKEFSELEADARREVLRQIRYRFSSNVHQMSRIVGMTYEEVAKIIDSHL